jgi:hypothetical protein
MQSARGASAFTQMGYHSYQPLNEIGFYGSGEETNPSRAWSHVIDELLAFRNLEDDWDSEGTEAPHPTVVDGAITLAQEFQAKGLVPPDRVQVSVNSTIYFEWHTSLGYQEVEVLTPIDAESRLIRKGCDVIEVVALCRRS